MSPFDHIQPLVITAGEPAGIGPDLCVRLAAAHLPLPLVVVADKDLLMGRAQKLGLDIQMHDYAGASGIAAKPSTLSVIHVPLEAPCHAGALNPVNSRYVLNTLDIALQGCRSGEFAGMVTAPVHKGVINDAGIPFTGHTEYLAERTDTESVVMMLVGGGMRVALATTHIALKDVPSAITGPLLEKVLRIIWHDLQRRFGIGHPRIFVAGLNPHAGEGGYLGREEIDVMIPVLNKLREEGLNVSTPLPADTLFTPGRLSQCDCVLSMYHDQGLPVLKHASFGQGVNVTLGLPVIRTSVDHGTALELAGTGAADSGSMLAAIGLAAQMAHHEQMSRQGGHERA